MVPLDQRRLIDAAKKRYAIEYPVLPQKFGKLRLIPPFAGKHKVRLGSLGNDGWNGPRQNLDALDPCKPANMKNNWRT